MKVNISYAVNIEDFEDEIIKILSDVNQSLATSQIEWPYLEKPPLKKKVQEYAAVLEKNHTKLIDCLRMIESVEEIREQIQEEGSKALSKRYEDSLMNKYDNIGEENNDY